MTTNLSTPAPTVAALTTGWLDQDQKNASNQSGGTLANVAMSSTTAASFTFDAVTSNAYLD